MSANTAKFPDLNPAADEPASLKPPPVWERLHSFDRELGPMGFAGLCGIDEAGRGPLAGPVLAAAVILTPGLVLPGLNDSKKLSSTARGALEREIRATAEAFALGRADVVEIDRLGILQATFLAMGRALAALGREPAYLLVDGRDYPFPRVPGRALVHGDGTSACVAAAGILAKEERDRELRRLDLQYLGWGFARHKGYGTAAHLDMLRERGRLPIHRRSFRLPWERDEEQLSLP